ncbi:uncharacterized protein METZ01_LOCUS75735 [marine metagenome]|uniref:Uncharacterized protein n=1 Tax=marine metagenome TaxID=408172 RepID=A0A381U560_9ZZZZ
MQRPASAGATGARARFGIIECAVRRADKILTIRVEEFAQTPVQLQRHMCTLIDKTRYPFGRSNHKSRVSSSPVCDLEAKPPAPHC